MSTYLSSLHCLKLLRGIKTTNGSRLIFGCSSGPSVRTTTTPTAHIHRPQQPALASRPSSSSARAGEGRMPPEPQPSSSILLLSPTNQVLLLHRVKSSSSFAAAHVFPGGNIDSFHDGEIPPPHSEGRHRDGPAYRFGAIRECFEETGILLARRRGSPGNSALLSIPSSDRDSARKRIHNNEIPFREWVDSVNGIADVEGLIPFTRWITPTNVRNPKRFTTQMYLYMIPDIDIDHSSTAAEAAQQHEILVPTPDGGVEHTAAKFDDASTWLARADAGEIILYPPQYFLLHMISHFCQGQRSSGGSSHGVNPKEERRRLLSFLDKIPTSATKKGAAHQTATIPWAEKAISPHNLFIRAADKRVVLGLDKPGPELRGSERGGDWERVVLVDFTKAGPRRVEVRDREDVLKEEKEKKVYATARDAAAKI